MRTQEDKALFVKRLAVLLAVVLFVLLGALDKIEAFVRSEDELMQAEIQEAKARAKDFKANQERMAKLEAEREKAVGEIKKQRARDEEEAEKVRQAFIQKRNSQPDMTAAQEKLEREDDERRAREEAEMDKKRREYLNKRAKVEDIINREAYIDPAEEYDLKPLPTTTKDGATKDAVPGGAGAGHGSFDENF